jgi:hypothetical protein
MQITITIPDEFVAQVQARGLSPESYFTGVVENAIRAASTVPTPKPQRDMQAFFRDMAAYSEKIPQLPEEAFSRESFYQDHD